MIHCTMKVPTLRWSSASSCFARGAPSFQEYTVGSEKYKVYYRSRLAPSSPSGVVFGGTIMRIGNRAKHNVVIKLTATYCIDTHRRLAEIDRASCLVWSCELVEWADMYVLVMDYEDGADTYGPPADMEHIEQPRIRTLRGEDCMHGNIWGPNVLITASGLEPRL